MVVKHLKYSTDSTGSTASGTGKKELAPKTMTASSANVVVENTEISSGLMKILEEPVMDISPSTGAPESVRTDRHVFIYQPSKSAMTSGRSHINARSSWALEFDHDAERWENPLIGWTSTRDTLNQLNLRFETAEDAVRFARKNGWSFEVRGDTQESEWKSKAYADNFKYSAGKLRQITTK